MKTMKISLAELIDQLEQDIKKLKDLMYAGK